MNPSLNPLLDVSGLPRFADFKPELVTPAVEQLLAENRALIARLAADTAAPTWDNFAGPLEDANERLHRAWGQVGHLNAVVNSPELRETYNGNLPKISQYYTELGQHEGLYKKFKALRSSAAFATLSAAQKKIIDNEVRDFRLGGAELAADKRPRYTEIRDRLSMLGSRFSDNLLDATNAWTHLVTDEAELAGLPADAREAARLVADLDVETHDARIVGGLPEKLHSLDDVARAAEQAAAQQAGRGRLRRQRPKVEREDHLLRQRLGRKGTRGEKGYAGDERQQDEGADGRKKADDETPHAKFP